MVENNINNEGPRADIRVRIATVEDSDTLVDFACKLAFDTENKTLDRAIVKRATETCIKNPALGCYFLAWDENDAEKKSVGTTMLTYEMSASVGGMIHMIQSVYVNADARRKGIFRALYSGVVEKAKQDPLVKCVRLYVELENFTAQAVYEKLGMTKMDSHNFYEIDTVFSH